MQNDDRSKGSILIVDDESAVANIIKSYFESESFKVFYASNAYMAFDILKNQTIRLIILDLMLPGITGEEFCAKVRESSNIPIIMLTAKSSEESQLKGFSCGADDYIVKPFSARDLVARAYAVLRRTESGLPKSNLVNFKGGLSINVLSHQVTINNKEIYLTPVEYKLLLTFINNKDKVLTREVLIEGSSGNIDTFDRTVDAHVKNLRQKIEINPKEPIYILTEYGFGYKFCGQYTSEL